MIGLKYHSMKLHIVTEYRNLLVFKFETSYINLTTCSVILIIELCTREAAEKDFLCDLLLLYYLITSLSDQTAAYIGTKQANRPQHKISVLTLYFNIRP